MFLSCAVLCYPGIKSSSSYLYKIHLVSSYVVFVQEFVTGLSQTLRIFLYFGSLPLAFSFAPLSDECKYLMLPLLNVNKNY